MRVHNWIERTRVRGPGTARHIAARAAWTRRPVRHRRLWPCGACDGRAQTRRGLGAELRAQPTAGLTRKRACSPRYPARGRVQAVYGSVAPLRATHTKVSAIRSKPPSSRVCVLKARALC
eukprot:1195896-Prorocentrum_minimum.AAC.1